MFKCNLFRVPSYAKSEEAAAKDFATRYGRREFFDNLQSVESSAESTQGTYKFTATSTWGEPRTTVAVVEAVPALRELSIT